jgi:Rnl2 family RNA ligase
MEFKKYNSIENSYQKREIDKILQAGYSVIDWCVTEKIHGSNLAIYCDGKTCQTASRNNMLNEHESDNFFKFGVIKQSVYNNVLNIFEFFALSEQYTPVDEVVVYGELFGGSYPHPDVDQNNEVPTIQKGVYYSPDIHFYVFDIMVNGRLISYDEVVNVCEQLSIPYCKILFSGGFEDCLNYPNDELTRIPNELGLPVIDDNISEGVVLKPIEPTFFTCGSRVILKNKNDKFKEKQRVKKKPTKPVELSEVAKHIIDDISEYINENRLDAVLSKFGEFDKKQIGEYIREFTKDVFADAAKDGIMKKVDKSEQKAVNKFVSTSCRDMIINRLRVGV